MATLEPRLGRPPLPRLAPKRRRNRQVAPDGVSPKRSARQLGPATTNSFESSDEEWDVTSVDSLNTVTSMHASTPTMRVLTDEMIADELRRRQLELTAYNEQVQSQRHSTPPPVSKNAQAELEDDTTVPILEFMLSKDSVVLSSATIDGYSAEHLQALVKISPIRLKIEVERMAREQAEEVADVVSEAGTPRESSRDRAMKLSKSSQFAEARRKRLAQEAKQLEACRTVVQPSDREQQLLRSSELSHEEMVELQLLTIRRQQAQQKEDKAAKVKYYQWRAEVRQTQRKLREGSTAGSLFVVPDDNNLLNAARNASRRARLTAESWHSEYRRGRTMVHRHVYRWYRAAIQPFPELHAYEERRLSASKRRQRLRAAKMRHDEAQRQARRAVAPSRPWRERIVALRNQSLPIVRDAWRVWLIRAGACCARVVSMMEHAPIKPQTEEQPSENPPAGVVQAQDQSDNNQAHIDPEPAQAPFNDLVIEEIG